MLGISRQIDAASGAGDIRRCIMEYVYSFRDGIDDRLLMGNKGANLVSMTKLGFPVPPGFIITIKAYERWRETGSIPDGAIEKAMVELEKEMGKKLGEGLEVSVRSSGATSMPGMMDTLLNLGDMDEVKVAVRQIFGSWDNPRAVEYRRLNRISSQLGTAAIVQAMVYGNRDDDSGTGVIFTRNPATGETGLYGEYLVNAQGEDIVSGSRTPEPIDTLSMAMPKVYSELEAMAARLERHYCEMQDIEFTIESGRLYLLQTRSGKRTGNAAVRIAVEMIDEGLITGEEAIMRVSVDELRSLLHKQIQEPVTQRPLAKGLNAAPGAASGVVVFDAPEAVVQSRKGKAAILVRPETSPDDIQGIAAAAGVLTQKGGLTSHAAVVTRAMGKPCICGAEGIDIDLRKKTVHIDGLEIKEGDVVTIDGTTGLVYQGELPLQESTITTYLKDLMSVADGFKRLGVRANADTPDMIEQSLAFGAEGIGLCRTERMFNAPERLFAIREFILADNQEERFRAVERLRELQTMDFKELFKVLNGAPIIIRLLDLPLHEFLPPEKDVTDPKMRQRIEELQEINPMLGHRGVRVAVTTPEIYQMQIDAIETALAEVPANVSVMVPQVITSQEARAVKRMLKNSHLKFGVMMETVRACMRAGRLAEVVDFFSFGTNDLTQAVYSFSREDAEKRFLSTYLSHGILRDNPFEFLDVKGVGRLMETAIFWGRRVKQDIEIGVCGEQAGEPRSITYLHHIGVDYVSCSPFRVPIAKLVAAKAAIRARVYHTKGDGHERAQQPAVAR